MNQNSSKSQNWFVSDGEQYAQFRPQYPHALGLLLASLTNRHQQALDVGCGTGQLTTILAAYFDEVMGVDPSDSQIQNAKSHPKIQYQVSTAEQLPEGLRDLDLITVAQAAHWFDLPRFYQEVTRVLAPDGVLALISYGVMQVDEAIRARVHQFYDNEIGPYWPAERKLVDEGYQTIEFPFQEMSVTPMEIELEWGLEEMMGYISTWSAVKKAKDLGQGDLLTAFYDDMCDLWGDASQKKRFIWPINMRVGKLVNSTDLV